MSLYIHAISTKASNGVAAKLRTTSYQWISFTTFDILLELGFCYFLITQNHLQGADPGFLVGGGAFILGGANIQFCQISQSSMKLKK